MTPQEFLDSLIELEIAKKDNVKGCSEQNVKDLEEHIGSKLPEIFKDFLLLMGQSVGNYSRCTNFLFKDLFTITDLARKTMLVEGVELPNDAFVIFSHQGCIFGYFRLSDGNNPPIYTYSISGSKPIRFSDSFTEYLDKSLVEEKNILKS